VVSCGRQWCDGSDRLFVSIGDVAVALASENPELGLWTGAAAKYFVVDEMKPDVTIRAAWAKLSGQSYGEEVFDSGALWRLYRVNGFYLFRFTSQGLGVVPYKVAWLNRDFTSGEVYLHPPFFRLGQPVNPLEYPLDELLIVNLLALGRGVEVHACGMVDDRGSGHLLAGQSGAGKTTIARLLHKAGGITVLSDDRIILRRLEGRLWMYGTPWHGDAGFASPARAPLSRVYFLRHGPKNELVPQRTTQAVARLFTCSFPPFYFPEGLNFTLEFLEQVAKAVPCYELRFVPDESVVEFVSEAEMKD